MESNTTSNTANTSGTVILAKKSWVAYIKTFLVSGLVAAVVVAILSSVLGLPDLFSTLIWAVLVAISIYNLSSYVLYYDNDGVWLFSGIFPWSKAVRGVKWADLDEALYFPGFFSWAMKSYNIRLAHRFTKSSEIWLKDMAKGDIATMSINDYHIDLIRQKNQQTP